MILWFGDVGRLNSFSRVTESVVPHIEQNVLLLVPPKDRILDWTFLKGRNYIHIGDPIEMGESQIDFQQFKLLDPTCPQKQQHMKYVLLQIGYITNKYDITHTLFLGGNHVVEWYMRLINTARQTIKSKIIVWTPFDYIPTIDCMRETLKCDYLLTMNPTMSDILSKYKQNVDWVYHGIDNGFYPMSNKQKKPYRHKYGIKKDETVILNANNFVPRKRLDITLEAFAKCARKNKKIKLWLHTNTQDPQFKAMLDKYDSKNIITTMNNVSTRELNVIYNLCKIGIQTSTGEGFGMVSLEHSKTGAIQIVPDFLGTGFNFRGNGILVPVTPISSKDELGNDITIGQVGVEDTAKCIEKALITPLGGDTTQFTWEEAAKKLGLYFK